MNSLDYLRAFLLGSTLPITLHYFVQLWFYRQKKTLNYSYHLYSIIAPIYFGLMSMLALTLYRVFGLTRQTAFVTVFLLSASFINLLNRVTNIYELTEEGWQRYYIETFLRHGWSFLQLYFFYALFGLS